jgi:hypothetical protein
MVVNVTAGRSARRKTHRIENPDMSDARDLFGSGGGGGAFPKIDEFEHKLVILKPSALDIVPKYRGKPGETQERITADVVVFAEDGSVEETIDDMYFSQVGIVNPCKKALKPNAKPMVLGVVSKVPSKQTKGMTPPLDTPEKVYEGLETWRKAMAAGKKAEEPKFAWGLLDFSEEQGAFAMAYLQASSPLASGAE